MNDQPVIRTRRRLHADGPCGIAHTGTCPTDCVTPVYVDLDLMANTVWDTLNDATDNGTQSFTWPDVQRAVHAALDTVRATEAQRGALTAQRLTQGTLARLLDISDSSKP